MTLENSTGKGGNCNKTSECKGSLKCLEGVCSSIDVKPIFQILLQTDSSSISAETNSTKKDDYLKTLLMNWWMKML